MNNLRPFTYSDEIYGVRVKPITEDGNKVSVLYDGLLVHSGAKKIVIHAGFGDLNNWKDVLEVEMNKSQTGFEAFIEMKDKQLNFCFKDNISNWDNNSGNNWVYRIYQ